jgi:hypothetical protein
MPSQSRVDGQRQINEVFQANILVQLKKELGGKVIKR